MEFSSPTELTLLLKSFEEIDLWQKTKSVGIQLALHTGNENSNLGPALDPSAPSEPSPEPVTFAAIEGNLPLAIAQVVPPNFLKKRLQSQAVGELGGSPYGPNSGKTTFGKDSQESSLQSLMAARSLSSQVTTVTEAVLGNTPDNLNLEATEEKQNKIIQLKNQMDQLSFKLEPFSQSDYKSYEKAKELFKVNEKEISKLDHFDESFVQNARELFFNHSWRDKDKEGKKPYEAFIDAQEPKLIFPFPTEQVTKPQKHPEGISH
jgi:hypothetical protein